MLHLPIECVPFQGVQLITFRIRLARPEPTAQSRCFLDQHKNASVSELETAFSVQNGSETLGRMAMHYLHGVLLKCTSCAQTPHLKILYS